jgi:uncharacterized protein YcfJ
MKSNRYLVKIAEQHRDVERDAAATAGKAILSDKVGDFAGAGIGGAIAHAMGKSKTTGALIGAGVLGTGLTYASVRRDYLNSHKGT